MNSVKVAIIHDTRRALQDGTFPVKLRVTHQRKQKYYPTIFTETKEDFAKVYGQKPRESHKRKLQQFVALEHKANHIIEKMPFFTFDTFERKFYDTAISDDVFSAFTREIEKRRKTDPAGTVSSYENAYLSILSFVCNKPSTKYKGLTRQEISERKKALLELQKPLPFAAVTVDFLKNYEQWMLENGNSLATVGIYLRNLKAIFNEAIANDELNPNIYPFGKRKYQTPTGRNNKRSLTPEEINKLDQYEPAHEGEAKALDLWMFTYYCNGINMKDIARLKYRNISQGIIKFVRAKTERTTRQNRKNIEAVLLPEVEAIIQRWGNKPTSPDSFVFPILSEGLSPEKEQAKIRQIIKTVNYYMNRIGKAVGIDKNLTTYTARYSYSNVMRKAGAPIEVIQEALGHKNSKTTEIYLDSIRDDVKQHYAKQLTSFREKPKEIEQ